MVEPTEGARDGPACRMSRYRLSPAAASELDELLEYLLREGGPGPASRAVAEFSRAFELLAEQPGIGRMWDELSDQSVRLWPVWSYLVVHEPAARPLTIVRILHGSRDLRRLLEP